MNNIQVFFKHYKCLFPLELAQDIIAPYYQIKERKQILMDTLIGNINLEYQNNYQMDDLQFKCGNEIFPEFAVSDPLSDLNTYDEWQNGRRNYPFKGIYPPFGISSQLEKIESSSSFGVVGEVLAGLFSQSYFAPFVLVRNIRRWPDFIFYNNSNKYVFVESKATASEIDINNPKNGDFEKDILSEFVMDAMQSVLNNQSTNICLSQTRISGDSKQRIFHLCILEMECDSSSYSENTSMPPSVVSGLAYQIVDQYISSLFDESGPLEFSYNIDEKLKYRLKNFYRKKEIESFKEGIYEINSLEVNTKDDQKIDSEIKRIIKKISNKNNLDFKNIGKSLKQSISKGVFQNVSNVCNQSIFYKKMNSKDEQDIMKTWTPDWDQSVKYYKKENNNFIWRCGNSFLYVT